MRLTLLRGGEEASQVQMTPMTLSACSRSCRCLSGCHLCRGCFRRPYTAEFELGNTFQRSPRRPASTARPALELLLVVIQYLQSLIVGVICSIKHVYNRQLWICGTAAMAVLQLVESSLRAAGHPDKRC